MYHHNARWRSDDQAGSPGTSPEGQPLGRYRRPASQRPRASMGAVERVTGLVVRRDRGLMPKPIHYVLDAASVSPAA